MRRSSILLLVSTCAAIVVIDQFTKAWVRDTVPFGLISHVWGRLYLTHVANTGLVFGVGQGHVIVPALTSVLILALIPIALYRAHRDYGYSPSDFETVCIGAVAGGAIGNLIDRISISHVTDFLLFRLWGQSYWPAFNVADSAIVTGTILLVLSISLKDIRNARRGTQSA